MPGKNFNLSPESTPSTFFDQNKEYKEEVKKVPDGTSMGLSFLTEDGEFHQLGGPRFDGKLICSNGGAIDNKDAAFFSQLQQEFREETFGMLTLEEAPQGGYQLRIKGVQKPYPLTIATDHTFVRSGWSWTFVTFTAVCEGLTLAELKAIASAMNPTAKFWHTIGSYLHRPQDQITQENTRQLINSLEGFTESKTEKSELLISPQDVLGPSGLQALMDATGECHLIRMSKEPTLNDFKETTVNQYIITDTGIWYFDQGINTLEKLGFLKEKELSSFLNELRLSDNRIVSLPDLKLIKTYTGHTPTERLRKIVGDYSERSAYHVFNVKNLAHAMQNKEPLLSVTGIKVSEAAVDADEVFNTLPIIEKYRTRSTRETVATHKRTRDYSGRPSQVGSFAKSAQRDTQITAAQTNSLNLTG